MSGLYSTLRGFKFNSKHIYTDLDFVIVMQSKSIQPPSKKKIKDSIPFMNGSYDFSTVGSNGEITYTEREITVILGLPANSKEQLHLLYSKTLEWLVDVGQSQLIFDGMEDYYFMAEVESASTFEEIVAFGKLTVVFIAEPFKTGINLEGSDIWDTFNFEEDIIQDIEFDLVTIKTITLYNSGRLIMPVINCTAVMSVIKNGITYGLIAGNNTLYGFKLQSGANTIIVTGTGHIKFMFRKVSL